jgi:hypothetical protein
MPAATKAAIDPRMTRESRLIVILLVMAVVGVSGLSVVGNQYRKALTGGAGAARASARADELVDGFLAARAAAKAVLARYPGDAADVSSSYRIEREHALTERRMSATDYVTVRAAWRRQQAGQVVTDEALAGAFRSRQADLAAADLGAAELLDDAIK